MISALVTMAAQRDKARAPIYLGMVKAATVFFPDGTRSAKPVKDSALDEEERVAKAMSRERDPVETEA